MKFETIEPQLELNDPERGFHFLTKKDAIILNYVDWRNIKVSVVFGTVYSFSYKVTGPNGDLPAGRMLELMESRELQKVKKRGLASKDEEIHHYVISTNEDEWCEVVAGKYLIQKVGEN
ncbi:MAG: hypothetical protein JXR76_26545 [Deltaproteobacteria bacterium]|nr:hypothetical protein [Deltaproteobacteria bacterium]